MDLSLKWLTRKDSDCLIDLSIVQLATHEQLSGIISVASDDNASDDVKKMLSITMVEGEISVICPSLHVSTIKDQLSSPPAAIDSGWICFHILGNLEFSLIGILACISSRLAAFNVSIFALSTYNTDYILVKKESMHMVECILHNFKNSSGYAFLFTNLIASTGFHSRIETIIGAIHRIPQLHCVSSSNDSSDDKTICIHCVGADENEFPSMDSIPVTYSRLFTHLADCGYTTLQLLFIGPNMIASCNSTTSNHNTDTGREFAVNSTCHSGTLNITVAAYTGLYHEVYGAHKIIPPPDLLVLFHAGVWGYNDWLPTLDMFSSLPSLPYILVTSYTVEEAEDDYDTIASNSHASSTFTIDYLWEEEINPHRSCCLSFKRATSDRQYTENYAWQCYQFKAKEAVTSA